MALNVCLGVVTHAGNNSTFYAFAMIFFRPPLFLYNVRAEAGAECFCRLSRYFPGHRCLVLFAICTCLRLKNDRAQWSFIAHCRYRNGDERRRTTDDHGIAMKRKERHFAHQLLFLSLSHGDLVSLVDCFVSFIYLCYNRRQLGRKRCKFIYGKCVCTYKA